jgi:hypothetical protein
VVRESALLATCYLCGSCSPTGPSPAGLDWGRRMRRIKGGVHCQKRYRELGWHPLDNVSRAMPKRHNGSARTPEGGHRSDGSPDHARKRLGITLEQMRGIPKITPLWMTPEFVLTGSSNLFASRTKRMPSPSSRSMIRCRRATANSCPLRKSASQTESLPVGS